MAVSEMTESQQRVGGATLGSFPWKSGICGRWRLGVTAGSRRAAWRIIAGVEQQENFKGMEQQDSHAREYVAKVEDEIQRIRDGISAFMTRTSFQRG